LKDGGFYKKFLIFLKEREKDKEKRNKKDKLNFTPTHPNH